MPPLRGGGGNTGSTEAGIEVPVCVNRPSSTTLQVR
jgi:hypothetical protein